ncbi:MAG: replicative DNA helicase [Rickettsiales bacterium]
MSREAEIAIVSILLKDNAKIQDVKINSNQFDNQMLGHVFGVIKSMLANREVVDVITVAEKLGEGRDWLGYLTDVAVNSANSRDNFKAYCKLVESSFYKRQAMTVGEWLKSNSGESGAVNEAIKKLMAINTESQDYEHDLSSMMREGLAKIDYAFKNKGALTGVDTGLTDLNHTLGGFHDGDLVVIGARPAMGKTSILLNMLTGAKAAVGCISGEQGVAQISQRLISIKSNVSLMNMRNGNLTDQDFNNMNGGVIGLKQHPGIWTFDKSSPSIDDIESTARKWKFEHDIKALYVDYLQKIKRDESKNKAEAVGDNAARLKDLARELEIPVICLAQVKRDVENRTNKRPLMGDLSDSSEIEKEADQIIMLYRDEVYNPDTTDKGVMELSVEKNRHGATGKVFAKWDGRYLSVSDFSRSYE